MSGGTDSTYVALKLKELGLRPLIVHLDNGWNSELAVKNIENIINKLGFDLYTLVINWEEFRDLQLSYLKASVLDLEVTSDHAILAVLYKEASKRRIKYIINGSNIVTEGILPETWRYDAKTDLINLKAIHRRYGKQKLKTFPKLGIFRQSYYTYGKGIRMFNLLDYLDYNKEKAKKEISEKLGWRDYGGKHYESIITRFYQGYILPRKFGIDKRRAHLSTLICSGQITRAEALKEIEKPPYDEELLRQDLEYIPKKLGLSKEEFEAIMQLPSRDHDDFPNEKKYRKKLGKIRRFIFK